MSDSLRLPFAQAEAIALKVADALRPHCRRLDIAGSIRRRRAYCGDIDIVCIPAGIDGRQAIIQRCSQSAKLVKNGEQYVVFELSNGFQLDLWFAHEGTGDLIDPDPSNYGVLLLARTGSAMHNVWIAHEAKRQHLHFNPHRGLLKRGRVIASVEESEIFHALGIPFVMPERRERS